MASEILIIFLLLLLNAFFALSEIAVVSSRRAILRDKATKGSKGAQIALELAEEPGKFLSTVQVGITLVGILAGTYGGAKLTEKLAPVLDGMPFIYPHGETVAVVVIVSAITYFSVVIGELVPKQFALVHAESLAVRVSFPMLLLSRICKPVVVILEVSARVMLALLGVKGAKDLNMTEAEVKAFLKEGAMSGAIEEGELAILQRVIRLGDRDVKSIMTHRTDLTMLDVKDSPDEIIRTVHEGRHSHYPVSEGRDDHVIGIVHAKDLLEGSFSGAPLNLRDYLKLVPAVPESSSCLQVMELFKKSDLNFAVVVDEYGATEGIVTSSDILEAIIGVLPSNYNEGEKGLIIVREDGSWLVDGRTSIDEIHMSIGLEEIDIDAPYETIAGFVLHELGRPPQEGDVLESLGYRFEVIDMDNRRIDKVLIERLLIAGDDEADKAASNG